MTLRVFSLLFFISPSWLAGAQEDDFTPGILLLKLKHATKSQQALAASEKSLGIASLDRLNKSFRVTEAVPLFENRLLKRPGGVQALARIIKVTLPEGENIEALVGAYQQDPNVEYVQPNYLHRLHFVPDDSLFNDQVALQIVRAEAAWDVQLASSAVIVGVIDTGIDYKHEDLSAALWINAGEDLDGNGQVDSTDFNGLDDDGNGFVDDIRGWDFTDAPSFPDGGDFRTPDNDPMDQNGHGTSVAGIIGATGNNRKGIAGLAFGCRIMNLRAGTSLGFLEEDDVASAIVYAVENGARIINMSFGDEVASPLLRDVVQYAYSRGCVLVASAGNSNSPAIHFPSGFAETISVGATNDNDQLAGFSNFGSSVDVTAPGVNVLTTTIGNNYGRFSGTSASAPFVSALAALSLSKIPQLTQESVKGLVTSTSDDLGEPGWDNRFASGRINALKALQAPHFSTARILKPRVDQGFATGPIAIEGTAAGALLSSYVLDLGIGETPTEWVELFRQDNRQVVDELLFELTVNSLVDTIYTLRLTVENKDGTAVEDKVRFFIDRTPPLISAIKQTQMIDGSGHSLLLEFKTDDLCDAAVHFRPAGSTGTFQVQALRFRTRNHRVNLSQTTLAGRVEFFLQAENGSGLSSVLDNNGALFGVNLSTAPIGGLPIRELLPDLPSAFLLEKSSDFDGDGSREVILNQYDGNFNFGPLQIFEFVENSFVERTTTTDVFIPRDWGDSDGDGLLELFAGRGAHSFIFEASAPGEFPTEIVWSDSGAWASRFADLDQDGMGEIVVRLDALFTVWETIGDNAYAQVASLPNPTRGQNFVGVPRSEIADFDGDGRLEILFGDFDGDVYIYENSGNDRYEFTWSDALPLLDTIDYLSVGDYDGDGTAEFVVGCHSDPNLNLESEFDSRHWLYRVYKASGDNAFEVAWEQAFFGFQSPADFDSGVSSGDLDNDGRAEILIGVFPDFYLADFKPISGQFEVAWHAVPTRSNQTVVDDFDGNGVNEFYFNNGERVIGHQVVTGFGGPPTPLAVRARPLDLDLVELLWQPGSSPDGFQVYRGTALNELGRLTRVSHPPFLDRDVSMDVDYFYTVTALDSGKVPPESLSAPSVAVRPGAKPFLENARFIPPSQVQLVFSERMDQSVRNQNNFRIEEAGTPSSAIVARSGREVILTSASQLAVGSHKVTATNVFDLDGTPIDTLRNSTVFQVTSELKAPYLVSAVLSGQNRLRLKFSQAMDAASVGRAENYVIEPNIRVETAALASHDRNLVELQLASSSPIGPFGIEYFITVRNVKSQQGVAIKFGEGNSAALVFSSPDLSRVFAYPNPFSGDAGQELVTIAGLTRSATVRILDASGRHVRTLEETDGNGGVEWDLKDDSDRSVPSGIYLFYVVGEGHRAVGKLAVVR